MKIIQHGRRKTELSTIKRFKCNACGCVFECDKDEYSKWNDFDGEMPMEFYSSSGAAAASEEV